MIRLTLLILFFFILGTGWLIWHDLYTPPLPSQISLSATFRVAPDDSASAVAERLESDGLLRNRWLFIALCKLTGAQRNLHVGYYRLTANQNMLSILDTLQEKQGPAQLMRVTLPEGLTLWQVADRLSAGRIQNGASFLATVSRPPAAKWWRSFPYLEHKSNYEGFLFPDTYLFAPDVPVDQILYTLLTNFHNQIYQRWENRQAPAPFNFYETLNLASIVQQESALVSEMPLIAGVFKRRLDFKMRLNADPTVRYALGNPEQGGVFWKDLDVQSPYNTYRNPGLPPTPICSPGLDAFVAALQPEQSNALYFLSKNDGSGAHDFSRSLEEHNAKRWRYGYEKAPANRQYR